MEGDSNVYQVKPECSHEGRGQGNDRMNNSDKEFWAM